MSDTNVDTKTAMLLCEGTCRDDKGPYTTRHTFAGKESQTRKLDGAVVGWLWMFKCDRCGVSRKWGVEAA